jgi:hypothetical protein
MGSMRSAFLFGTTCLALAGCGGRDQGEPAANPLSAAPVDPAIAAAATGWSHQQTTRADLDGDGVMESVVLTSDVSLDRAGRPLWEDGHRWAVFVAADGPASPVMLYAAFVPHGRVEAAIAAPDSDGKSSVVVVERQPTRLRVVDVRYESGKPVQVRSEAFYHLSTWAPSL